METMAQYGEIGYNTLSLKFNLCYGIQTEEDYLQLLYTIRNAFAQVAINNYPYARNNIPANPVEELAKLIAKAEPPTQALLDAITFYYNLENKTCIDPDSLFYNCADPAGCGEKPEAYAHEYQACFELSTSEHF